MAIPSWIKGPPARLLLATDLSARCDRALDRAMQLAGQWQAEVVVLTVIEHARMPDQVLAWMREEGDGAEERVARRTLQRELARHPVNARIEVARGDVPGAIRSRAQALHCNLIVAGVARAEPFGRLLPGSTTENLARAAAPLLLVVRNRVHGPYGPILVLSDFSEGSRHALLAALRLFPDNEVVLYHAYHSGYSGLAGEASQQQGAREAQYGEAPRFLEQARLTQQERARVRVVVEAGPVEIMAARYVRDHDIQLAVAGSHGRTGILELLLGSTAARLLEWLPCDTLVVREPKPKG